MDFPAQFLHGATIHSIGEEAMLSSGTRQISATNPGSSAWPSANRALYIPFWLRTPYLARKLWWANGGVVTANVDCGIYSAGGTLLVSTGSTAMSGANTVQSVDVNYWLTPGRYFMALVLSGTSQIQRAVPSINAIKFSGMVQETSALPLPAVMTPETCASAYYPFFGLTNRTLI